MAERYGGPTRDARRAQKREMLRNARHGIELNQHMPSADIGVLCLMNLAKHESSSDEILSWSHYAGGHRGVAIGFRVRKELPANLFSYAHEVQYYDVKPVVDVLNKERFTGHGALAKASCWKYEKEWRLLSIDTPQDPFEIRRSIDSGEIEENGALHQLLMFPPCVNSSARFDADDLVEVRLGARLSEVDVDRVLNTLKMGGLDLRVVRARIDRRSFRLVYDDYLAPNQRVV
jgi:Protein of unknown function (DUF2971)